MQLQLWSDLSQLSSSSLEMFFRKYLYGQPLQWGVSMSSLEYGFHQTVVSNVDGQHLEWLVSFNGHFHLLQECCINRFLHKQKMVEATNQASQLHDTHTASYCVCIYIHMHAKRPALVTAPVDTYVKNATSTMSILCGQNTESALEWVHEVHAVSSVTLYIRIIMEPGQFFLSNLQKFKLTGEFAEDTNGITKHCSEGVFVRYFDC